MFELKGSVSGLQDDMQQVKATAGSLQEKVDGLETRMERLEEKVDGLKDEIVAEVTTAMGELMDQKVAAIISAATAAASRSNSNGLKLSRRFFKKGSLQRQAESVCRVS